MSLRKSVKRDIFMSTIIRIRKKIKKSCHHILPDLYLLQKKILCKKDYIRWLNVNHIQ